MLRERLTGMRFRGQLVGDTEAEIAGHVGCWTGQNQKMKMDKKKRRRRKKKKTHLSRWSRLVREIMRMVFVTHFERVNLVQLRQGLIFC
jgi:hypothetical protein